MILLSPGDFLGTYGFLTTFSVCVLVGGMTGAFGCFLYLRGQSLISDVVGHSCLLGIAVTFITASIFWGTPSTPVLIVGAAISGVLAVGLTGLIIRHTRLGGDAAMAVTLSLFYGGAMVIMNLLNSTQLTGRASLGQYILGNAATARMSDIKVIGVIAVILLVVVTALWKEFSLLVFDPACARALGFSPAILEPLLFAIPAVAIVSGIKAVGMILMVAFTILPAATVGWFSRTFSSMVLLSALVGALSGAIGAYVSICLGKVPTGPVVVLILFTCFLVSLSARVALRKKGVLA
ncbi:MAG: iron chelate uptake ABC transporter family permease subunit [Corynebacterium glucuronolyticum]|nr:metal ABC transporter permease [Corynebacterium glucuronolyticum]MDD7586076.1 iron chelate uptake ABC transporter family permease subunit [Mycobacteriaceae bacterium]MDY5833487.1 iron chelate uptake ABC transporter family permease subunit [Corynebacterium glucuronolyticum]